MASIRLLFLWHMHQPFYKDLVTGEYRLPWVRLHALKDYYGMVHLLEEFPDVHMTFNLVPSLVAQIEEYAAGVASDPVISLANKPAQELTIEERRAALQYFFQANPVHLIGRYLRYRELFETHAENDFDAERSLKQFSTQDFTDLQILSQLAWFDEFHLQEPAVLELVRKGRRFTDADRLHLFALQTECIAKVLPAYVRAAGEGRIELSTSAYYHPILPLICDTNTGAVSTPGLRLPRNRYRHPEDAIAQMERARKKHETTFGAVPMGLWPSEGSVSEESILLAAQCGFKWMASDEGVLGRSTGHAIIRDPGGVLDPAAAKMLYRIHRFEKDGTAMHMLFRDHTLSDLIGFVYSGMAPKDAALHFLDRVRACAAPVLAEGRDAVVPVILDGENCWEYYSQSGREFLRQLYAGISKDPQVEALTFSETISRTPETDFGQLDHIIPGSWINANFDIWIGSEEDRRSWDLLSEARDFYTAHAESLPEVQRNLAYEELLVAQGSDWNWWYGPEHHSANDAEFDELYRKHISNMYQAMGSAAPDEVGHPIATVERRSLLTAQSAHICPAMDGHGAGFFDWMGAAQCRVDRRQSAMHGKQFLLDCAYAGQDDRQLYLRLDFNITSPSRAHSSMDTLHGNYDVAVNLERHREGQGAVARRLTIRLRDDAPVEWDFAPNTPTQCRVCSGRVLVAAIPLEELQARRGDEVRITFSLWQDGVPVDSLPDSGWMHLRVMSHDDLRAKQAGEEWVV